jgi:hypothetical protein
MNISRVRVKNLHLLRVEFLGQAQQNREMQMQRKKRLYQACFDIGQLNIV